MEDFITIYLESAFGEWLIRAFCAYRSCVGKLLGDAVKLPNFICPSICTVRRARRDKHNNKLIFGADVLETCISYIWTRIQLQWPMIPTSKKEKIAKARAIVFCTMWTIVEKYSARVHNVEKLSILTPKQKKERHPTKWDGYELEDGITIVSGPYNISIEILDSKLVKTDSDKKRDWESHSQNFYKENICIAGNWQPGFEWFRTIHEQLLWAVSVLTPNSRYYTSSMYNNNTKLFKNIPIQTVPLPSTPIVSDASLQIDQSKFGPTTNYIQLHKIALKRLKDNGPDYYKHGVRYCPFPRRPSITDFTPSTTKKQNSDTTLFHNEMMQKFISEYGPSFNMCSVDRHNWKLSVYDKGKKRTRGKNNTCHFQPLTSMRILLGKPKLFGGIWTSSDLTSLAALKNGCQSSEVLFDLKSARHSCIAIYYAFSEVFKSFVSRNDHGLVTGWEELRNVVKKREVHLEDKNNKQAYAKQLKLYNLCKPANWTSTCLINNESSFMLRKMIWSHPCMKNRQGNYRTDAIQLGTANPFKHWPNSLVHSLKSEDDDTPVLTRCHNMQMLSLHEQIQLTWTLRATKTWLEYINSRYEVFNTDPGLVNLRLFVRDLCTPPPLIMQSPIRAAVMPASSSSSSSSSSSNISTPLQSDYLGFAYGVSTTTAKIKTEVQRKQEAEKRKQKQVKRINENSGKDTFGFQIYSRPVFSLKKRESRLNSTRSGHKSSQEHI